MKGDREKPWFSRRLLRTSADGTYASFGGAKRVKFFADRVELAGVRIPLTYLVRLEANGNVLRVGYRVADGRVVEEYFRHDRLIQSKARAELAAAVSEMVRRHGSISEELFEEADSKLPAWNPVTSGRNEQTGRREVFVPTPAVLFPMRCPTCLGGVSTVALLRASSGRGHRTGWLVPACDRHPVIGDSIRVGGWKGITSGARFSFADTDYAGRFEALNDGEPSDERPADTELAFELSRGTRFVIYHLAVSVFYAGFLTTSRIHKRPAGAANWIHLPYSALTALVGWWSIPGIFLTPTALYTNFRGGVDLTPWARALVKAGDRVVPSEPADWAV